ncbi:MAG: LamG domain-containing protein [Planctomycetota bacterium]|jgi:hypothetical protein
MKKAIFIAAIMVTIAFDNWAMASMATHCVGHWKMNDNAANAAVSDCSGGGNHGTFNDPTGDPNTDQHCVTGKINAALSFDGSDDFVDVGYVIGDGAYTKAAWVKRQGGVQNNIISADAWSHVLWAPSSYSFKLSAGHNYHEPGGGHDLVQDSETLDEAWHFVAVTFDPDVESGKMVLYKDGAAVDEANNVPTQLLGKTYIGQFLTDYNFEGSIDNVMIFDKALTAEEIQTLYNGGQGTENPFLTVVSIVMNGSFEKDGHSIDFVTASDPPYRWCDVNLPAGKFSASLWSDWSTHGNYYLTIYSDDWADFDVNDMGTISQQVYLQDVNEIIFDLKLDTTWNGAWDPGKRSAVLLIDDEVVWESNSVGGDVRGEYLNQVYTIDEKYKDEDLHKLSLGIRVNVSGYPDPDIEYHAQWDFVKFDAHCGGFGYLPKDLNFDCYVDVNDLKLLTEQWLANDPNWKYDMFEDDENIFNFRDVAAFADYWMTNTDWKNWQEANCFEVELLSADLNNDGIVNLRDFSILAGDWRLTGPCIKGDIDRSGASEGVIDNKDLSIMAEQWLQKSWIYGL